MNCRHEIKEIYVDVDVKYKNYMSDGLPSAIIRGLLQWLPMRFKLYIRKSPNKRVHLKLVPEYSIPLFTTFQIRALLHDDPFRIRQDLARFHLTGDVTKTGRIFDEKFCDGVIKKAGKWIELF